VSSIVAGAEIRHLWLWYCPHCDHRVAEVDPVEAADQALGHWEARCRADVRRQCADRVLRLFSWWPAFRIRELIPEPWLRPGWEGDPQARLFATTPEPLKTMAWDFTPILRRICPNHLGLRMVAHDGLWWCEQGCVWKGVGPRRWKWGWRDETGDLAWLEAHGQLVA
jgi:hypothetical protein